MGSAPSGHQRRRWGIPEPPRQAERGAGLRAAPPTGPPSTEGGMRAGLPLFSYSTLQCQALKHSDPCPLLQKGH